MKGYTITLGSLIFAALQQKDPKIQNLILLQLDRIFKIKPPFFTHDDVNDFLKKIDDESFVVAFKAALIPCEMSNIVNPQNQKRMIA